MKLYHFKQNGFTIIELLVTISLIGIITFTISNFISVQRQVHNRITQSSNSLQQGQKVMNRIANELKFGKNYNLPNEQTITYDDDSSGATINCSISFTGGNIVLTRGGIAQVINSRQSFIRNLQFILVPDTTTDNSRQNRTVNILLTLQNGTTYQTTVFALNESDATSAP